MTIDREHDEAHGWNPGPQRVTIDREQIQRDAGEWLNGQRTDDPQLSANAFAFHCIALLAELEQADIERAKWQRTENWLNDKLTAAEARLAKVPALVEPLEHCLVYFDCYDAERTDGKTSPIRTVIADALDAWKADQPTPDIAP